jgi:hypothetical protein
MGRDALWGGIQLTGPEEEVAVVCSQPAAGTLRATSAFIDSECFRNENVKYGAGDRPTYTNLVLK